MLRDRATRLAEAHEALVPLITESLLDEVTALSPPAWFGEHAAYVSHLRARAPLDLEVTGHDRRAAAPDRSL